jgi:hypothetical protein
VDEKPFDGFELAKAAATPEQAMLIDALRAMQSQLLIVFLKRLGGSITIPVSEIDNTGQDLFSYSVDLVTREFTFQLSKKS